MEAGGQDSVKAKPFVTVLCRDRKTGHLYYAFRTDGRAGTKEGWVIEGKEQKRGVLADVEVTIAEFDSQYELIVAGKEKEDDERVNHPAYYCLGGIEVINAIEAWKLPYHLGNVVKYVARAPHKGEELTDLKKAHWYLDRYISLMERGK